MEKNKLKYSALINNSIPLILLIMAAAFHYATAFLDFPTYRSYNLVYDIFRIIMLIYIFTSIPLIVIGLIKTIKAYKEKMNLFYLITTTFFFITDVFFTVIVLRYLYILIFIGIASV